MYREYYYNQQERGDEDPDPVRVLSSRRFRARKAHPCDMCRTPIVAGESYYRTVMVGDEGLVTQRRHAFACWEEGEAA